MPKSRALGPKCGREGRGMRQRREEGLSWTDQRPGMLGKVNWEWRVVILAWFASGFKLGMCGMAALLGFIFLKSSARSDQSSVNHDNQSSSLCACTFSYHYQYRNPHIGRNLSQPFESS